MATTLVIGIGNPDRGDDALGLAVARAIAPLAGPGVTVLEERGNAADLVDRLTSAETAILIDAAVSGAAPGTVTRIDVRSEALPASWFAASTHGLGLAAALELAQALETLPPRCIVYAVEAADVTPGAPLSEPASAAIPAVVEAILTELEAAHHA